MEMSSREEGDPFSRGLIKNNFNWQPRRLAGQANFFER